MVERLGQKGISVCKDEFYPIDNLYTRFKNSESDIFHLEWIYLFENSEDPAATVVEFLNQIYRIKKDSDRFVWTIHDKCNHEQINPRLDRLVRIAVGRIADVVRVWDNKTKEVAKSSFNISEDKIEVLPRGNYSPEFANVEPSNSIDFEEEYGTVFLFFGMIREYKQVVKLIDTFKEIKEDSCLIIAGKPYEEKLKEKIVRKGDDKDVFLDLRYIPKERTLEYFNKCDWAVFPYRDIFNSGSVVLAMTLATPVIAPNKGVISSYLPEGNLVYENSLQEALRDGQNTGSEKLNSVSKENRERAKSYMNWDKLTEGVMAMYQD